MNEKVDLVELEVEGMSFVDLGDATEETRQTAPAPYSPDYIFTWGYASR
jgi:hypothetical protein